jgi:REP element-mobilizing transposase RayT
VGHRVRPAVSPQVPHHVTVRTLPGSPWLRGRVVAGDMGAVLKRRAARELPCRVAHFTILGDHIHMIVEADDREALSRGMQGLLSGLARVINRATGCSGQRWRDRYHARALGSPLAVRRCLVYVLRNARKHRTLTEAIDRYSSAAWFDGFAGRTAPRRDPAPVHAPSCWLLREGWRRAGGPIRWGEEPADERSG